MTSFAQTRNSIHGKTVRLNLRIFWFIILFLFIVSHKSYSQGNLLINPTRIVFEGNKQREEITVANTGQDTAVYAISFLQYRMTQDGGFEQVVEPDPGQMFADEFVRYFPRRVTLAPGEAQIVRMQLRRSPNMPEGEYRSHLYFRAVPDERPLGEDDIETEEGAIGVRLTPIFGITIPVIIRHGDVSADVSITDAELNFTENGPSVAMTLNRTGNKSVYGDISLEYRAPGQQPVQVGQVRGLAVYTPNTSRRFSMRLRLPEGLELGTGTLVIRYESGNDTQRELFAETELTINQ